MKYILLLLLSGCGTLGEYKQYKWVQISAPAESISWTRMSQSRVTALCGGEYGKVSGCALMNRENMHCDIYSIHSREEAKWIIDADGMFHDDHELKHCAGWRH